MSGLPTLLTPFDGKRAELTTVAGVDNRVGTHLLSGDAHVVGSFTMFACNAVAGGVDGDRITAGPANGGESDSIGPSIDYAIADRLGQSPLTLRVGGMEAQSRRTFGLDGIHDPGETNPARAFDRLFASIAEPPAMRTPLEQLRARRKDVLTAVRGRYQAMSHRVSTDDRRRLEVHANLIEQFQADIDRSVEIVCSDPVAPSTGGVDDFEDWSGTHDDVLGAAHNSLIASAFACQAVQVASINYSNFGYNTFPFLNGGTPMELTNGWHEVVHGHGTDDMRRIPMLWYHDMVVDLVDKLQSVPEGDGTVFDNTIVFFTTNLANMIHGYSNTPIIIVSGANTGLARGQHIELSERRSLADVWTTLSHVMGAPMDSFGWNVGDADGQPYNAGPIAELFA